MMKTFYYPSPKLLALALCLVLSAGCSKASKARRILEAADRDFKAEKYDKAEAEYQSVFRVSSLNPVAIRQLGFIYFEEGRQLAFVYLKRANEQDTNNAQVQLKLAELYADGGRSRDAIPLLESVMRSDPDNERALLLLTQLAPTNVLGSLRLRLETQLREGGQNQAGCHSALGWMDLRTSQISEAEAEFQKATALDPKLPSPYLGMAAICSLHKDAKGIRDALKTAAELSPPRSNVRLRFAEYEIQSGDEDAAKQVLLNITQQAPDYIPAWLMLMRLSFTAHKFEDCQHEIDKILAVDNNPPNFDALFELGSIALAQRDAPKAVSVFQRLEDAYNKKPMAQVRYYMALAQLMNHEQQKAIVSLNEALSLDRDYSPAVLQLADLDYREDKLTEAITLLSRLTDKHPENSQAQFALADVFMAQQRLDRALEVYNRMDKKFGKNPEILRRKGLVFQQADDTNNAHLAYEMSLECKPDYLPSLQNITALDVAQKHFEEAHHRLADILDKNPKTAELLLLQGQVYNAEGQTNLAESTFSKAIELDPELPDGYLNLARLYLKSHQEQQAIDRLAPLLAKTNLSAMLEVGEIEQSAGKYEQARDIYEKILTMSPESGPAINNLAYLYSEHLGNMDKALEVAEKARNLHPTDPNTADTLGWILFKRRQYSHALTLIQESVDKQPNDPEVQMHLGMAYYMMEEEKPARMYLQRAVSSSTDFPDKDTARRRLDILDIDPSKADSDMVQKLEDLTKQNPQDPVLLSRLASVQEERGETQKAAETLQMLISVNPENWPAMTRLARMSAGKDLRKALDLAKSAHGLAPNDGGASALLGELVYRSGDYPWSSSLLEEAAGQSPDDPSISYPLALADYAVGRVDAADVAMEKAAQAGNSLTNSDQARQFLALRAAAKDPSQAEASSALVKQILEKDPNNVPALMVSAAISEHRGQINDAKQTWEKALSIYPLFAPAMRELALTLSHSQLAEDQNKAYELAEKARTSLRDDLELAKTLGVLAYNHNDWNKSLLYLRQSSEQSTNDAVLLYYMGRDYDKLKRHKESTNALQRALALGLAENLAGEARTILQAKK